MKTALNLNVKRSIKEQVVAVAVFVTTAVSLVAINSYADRHANSNGNQNAQFATMDAVVVTAPRMATGKMDPIVVTAPRLVNDTQLAHAHRVRTVMPL